MASFFQVSPPHPCKHIPFISPIRVTCLASLILLDLVNWIAYYLLRNTDLVEIPHGAVSSCTPASVPTRHSLCRINSLLHPSAQGALQTLVSIPNPYIDSMAFEGLPLNLRPFKSTDLTYVYDKHSSGYFICLLHCDYI